MHGVGPPAQDAGVEEAAGGVEDTADDPITREVLKRCPTPECRVRHCEHVAGAQLHVREHDDDEASWEGEGTEQSC